MDHPALKIENFWVFEGIKSISENIILVQANTDIGDGKTVLLALIIEINKSKLENVHTIVLVEGRLKFTKLIDNDSL